MKTVQIITTSCNRRELEIEQVKAYFLGNGYNVSDSDFDTDPSADYILLSTCGFTQAAEDFALKTLDRIEAEKKPGCKVYVGGCLPKINGEVLKGYETFDPRNYEKVDDYFSMEHKFNEFKRPNTIGAWQVHPTHREHGLMSAEESNRDEIGLETSKENLKYVEEIANIIRENNSSTFRIQCMLGCACNCTYCAIKFAIGNIQSRKPEEILGEMRKGIDEGYTNFLLEGDSLGSYGLDIGTNLGELLDGVIELIEDLPVQISVPDVSPKYLDKCGEQIIKLAQKNKMFNFYIPIQSGSQKILDAMQRGYKIEDAARMIKQIKNACPGLKCGTSLIVGFPGETDEDLDMTIAVSKDIGFDYIYCHSYSDRIGTKASMMDNKVPGEVILERARKLKEALKSCTELLTIAEDTAGNRTCQG